MRSLDRRELELLKSSLEKKKDTHKITKLRTAIYARKSSEDEKQTSLKTQIEECTKFIDSYNILELTKEFQEDNVSGMFIDKRTEFNKMLDMADNGEIDVIVVMKLDRFSRSVEDASRSIKRIQQANCFLIAGDINCMPNTPSDVLLLNFMTILNQYYAQRAASDVMASECNNARKGLATGVMPYGYKIIRANKKAPPVIAINENESPAIKLIFKMIAQGDSYNQVIDELDSQGFKTRRGDKFCKSTLNSMLRNEKYCGNLIYNRIDGKKKKNRVLVEQFGEIRNNGAIPSIIDKKLFDNVKAVLSQKTVCRPRQNKSPAYILTGFLRCKLCGKPMSGSLTGSKRVRNYICPCHSKKGSEHCDTKDINADKLEKALKIVLTDIINDYLTKTNLTTNEIKSLYESYTQDTINYERKIKEFKNIIKRLIQLSAKTGDDVLINEYQKQIIDCNNEQLRLQERKTAKENTINRLNAILSDKDKIPTTIPTDKIFYNDDISRKLVRLLIDKIYIDNNEITIQFNS